MTGDEVTVIKIEHRYNPLLISVTSLNKTEQNTNTKYTWSYPSNVNGGQLDSESVHLYLEIEKLPNYPKTNNRKKEGAEW